MLRMGRSHCCCVCSAKNILASEKRKHTMRVVKIRLEAASSVSSSKFLADFQLLLLFFSQEHLSLWCHQTKRGREPEQTRLTVSYRLPASQHTLLLYKGCLETKCALCRLYPLLKATSEKCLQKNPKHFSFGQSICFVVFLIQENWLRKLLKIDRKASIAYSSAHPVSGHHQ